MKENYSGIMTEKEYIEFIEDNFIYMSFFPQFSDDLYLFSFKNPIRYHEMQCKILRKINNV